jgi:hypothetical protein
MRGGLHGVAYRLHRAFSLPAITAYMRDVLGLTDVNDQRALYDVASAARDAGDLMRALPAELAIDVQLIPVVPSLPEAYWQGARLKWDVEIPWHSPETGRSGTWRWSFFGSGSLTGEQILEYVSEHMNRAADNSPEEFGADWAQVPEIIVDDVIVLDAERAY